MTVTLVEEPLRRGKDRADHLQNEFVGKIEAVPSCLKNHPRCQRLDILLTEYLNVMSLANHLTKIVHDNFYFSFFLHWLKHHLLHIHVHFNIDIKCSVFY
jgi:hypothetical protein